MPQHAKLNRTNYKSRLHPSFPILVPRRLAPNQRQNPRSRHLRTVLKSRQSDHSFRAPKARRNLLPAPALPSASSRHRRFHRQTSRPTRFFTTFARVNDNSMIDVVFYASLHSFVKQLNQFNSILAAFGCFTVFHKMRESIYFSTSVFQLYNLASKIRCAV